MAHRRRVGMASALLLVLASGLAHAQVGIESASPFGDGGARVEVGQTVMLSAGQQRVLRDAFAWSVRDAGIVGSALSPRVTFVPIAGNKERTSYLNVKLKDRSEMIGLVAQSTPDLQTAPADARSASADASFANLIAQVEQRMQGARDRLMPSLRQGYRDVDSYSVRVPDGISAEIVAEALMRTGDYEYVSMDWLCYPLDTTPNDPLLSQQWYHTASRINTPGAWDVTQGSSSTIIGVVDSGVDLDHPDLQAAMVPGYNSVDNLAQVDGGNVNDDLVGHGSLVAGSAAAIGNNNTGVSGVGWNFGIMPIRVSNNASGTALLSEILEGARWASDNGAYSVNCSFGGAEDSETRSSGGHIRAEGHLLVFAAGNDGLANQTNDWEKVTIVGGSDQGDDWVSWSHTGIGIDCIAPAVSIRSTNRTGSYTYTTGTSFAAPITAGALALVHDANPALSADEVEFILLNSCDDKEEPGEDNKTGWGRINVGRAVDDAINGPSIINLPFEDSFADATLSTQWRNPVGDVGNSDAGVNEPSAPYAMNLDDADSIESIAMRAGVLGLTTGEIRFWTQHRGVESGESLLVEYNSLLSGWTALDTIVSDGSNQDEFVLHRYALPVLGAHDDMKLRFTAVGSDTTDDWYIDDVVVREFTQNDLPWQDGFEDGITLVLDWSASDAVATGEASNTPEGSMSARIVNQQSMTSADVDVSNPPSTVWLRYRVERQGVETGESLLVQYKDFLGNWQTLETIVSDGIDQSSFELRQLSLPVFGYGTSTGLRFTAQGNENDDAWYIDDVAISLEFVEDTGCPADLNGDGNLDFFDVSAFLVAYNAMDPAADFNGDGSFNFFDVSAFLSDFSAGCP
ncbi:MAG: S8 family serine peptidase [Phycisphaerales bacterium]|nr:S8 family serine peptidase [Phycisphaerales bacterium]